MFWDVVIQMIGKGFTSDTAIDRIYLVYGERRLIMRILRMMVQDRQDKVDLL